MTIDCDSCILIYLLDYTGPWSLLTGLRRPLSRMKSTFGGEVEPRPS
jgi:hypothetical protein